MMTRKRLLLGLALCWAAMAAQGGLWLPQMFQSGMVLQRGKPVPVWGTADPRAQVTLCWQKRTYTTQADSTGRWRIDLPRQKAGGPYTLTVSSQQPGTDAATAETRELTDVLVGDVWLCSGQSNVDVTIERVYPQYPDEIDAFSNDRIRLFRVQTDKDTHAPKADVLPTRWRTLTKENAWTFSALGTFLARRLYDETGVPQGIVCNSLGGTPIEAWISADSLQRNFPMLVARTRLYQDDDMVAAQALADQRANDRWFQQLNEADPGVIGQWTGEAYDDAAWPTVSQYASLVAAAGGTDGRGATSGSFVGSLWLRQHIHIDRQHAGKPARLLLGTLFDQDYTFVNGREVGRTYYQYPPRRYQIPEGLLHEGDNVLAVRFVNKYGQPHFIKEKPYMLIFAPGDTLRLQEEWRVSRGTLMPPCPQGGTSIQNLPTVLYNAMLHPLAPYALSGVVWYQGESNTDNPQPYAALLRTMMGNWRALWNEPELPFAIVQLANFMEPSAEPQSSNWAQLREAQRTVAAGDAHAELAVAIDLGEKVDIHPLRKKEVAGRVARCLDKLVYGRRVTLSPQPVEARRQEQEGRPVVVLAFDQPLQAGAVGEVEVAGADGRFVNAEAEAAGMQLTVRCPSGVAHVSRVRYAWKDNPVRDILYGQNGLPASPFEQEVK